MLNRVYIDNFRCFVNFELRLDQQQLILGLNGSGKSTLLEVLRALKALLAGNSTPESLFPASTRTRWETRSRQTFELDVDLGPGAMYQFKLELDSWGSPSKTKVRREFVSVGGRPIFEFLEGKVHLFNDNFEHKVEYPFDWFRSALATVEAGKCEFHIEAAGPSVSGHRRAGISRPSCCRCEFSSFDVAFFVFGSIVVGNWIRDRIWGAFRWSAGADLPVLIDRLYCGQQRMFVSR